MRYAAGHFSSWCCLCIAARFVLLRLALRPHLFFLSPGALAPPLLITRPRLPCEGSSICKALVPSSLGRDIGTLLQTLARHASVSGLAALTLRSLARQRGPAFGAGVNGRSIRLLWCRGVSRRRRPLLLLSVFPFDLDRLDRRSSLVISVFDSLYCYRGCL